MSTIAMPKPRAFVLVAALAATFGALIASAVWVAVLHSVKTTAATDKERLEADRAHLEGETDRLRRDVSLWKVNSPHCARTRQQYDRELETCVPL